MKADLALAHSHYSLGFGTASVEELAEWAAARGIPSLALTDIETLAGQIRFHDACRAEGIRPVTGVELRQDHSRRTVGSVRGRLILLVRDREGYRSLCRIVGSRRQHARSVAPEKAVEGSEGLFILSEDPAVIQRLIDGGEVDRRNVRLLMTAGAQGPAGNLPSVSIPEIVALTGDDLALHRLLLAIRHGLTVGVVRQSGLDEAEVRQSDVSAGTGAPAEGGRIAEACTLDLRSSPRILPRLPGLPPAGADSRLRERCRRSLEALELGAGGRRGDYEARLARELATIAELGFSDYFLAVAEIARGARETGVATAGRGSAAGSLVAYLLEITGIDPLATDLLFERFLHEHRIAPPDIDLDVASTGRDSLIEWVVRRFGRERVAGVAAYSSYRARSAVRAGLAALGIQRSQVEQVLRRLASSREAGEADASLVERVLEQSPNREVRRAAKLVRRLLGVPSHLAAHPGGLIIGDRPLSGFVPLERAPGGMVVTQYDHQSVERAGFLKIDLLGNHFLSEMQESLQSLPEDITIPDDDERTWETLDAADTVGCFQVESPAVRAVLRRLPMKRFPDLVAALAVVRPGAAAGASKERYARRARGEEGFEPLEVLGRGVDAERYRELRDRLQRTYGVLLYDEDIIRLLSTVGGMSLASADSLRSSLIDTGEDERAVARLGDDFIDAALSSGAERSTAERAWQAASRFASYSFAEAHAASYADLAWKAAWLRTHAPIEFGCALLNHHRALYPLRTTAAAVQRWGVDLLPPSVNRSQLAATVEDGRVRIGLAAIKGLSRRTAGEILACRPFSDLGGLIDAARPARREIRALLLCGACDDLPPLSPAGYPLVHEVVLDGLEGEVGPDALSGVLRRLDERPREGREARELDAYRLLVRVRNEIELLGMHVSEHPMRLLRAEADRLGCLTANQLEAQVGRHVRFAGVLAASRRVPVEEGELRYLTWEDETGLVEGVLFPLANERLGQLLTTPGPYLLGGTMRETDGAPQLAITELSPFHER